MVNDRPHGQNGARGVAAGPLLPAGQHLAHGPRNIFVRSPAMEGLAGPAAPDKVVIGTWPALIYYSSVAAVPLPLKRWAADPLARYSSRNSVSREN